MLNNTFSAVRLLAALWAGKALVVATRALGRGGTTLPGRVALNIYPRTGSDLAARLKRGSLAITGTNGKTTTAALVYGILEESGIKCVHNRSGSNMAWGVASALVEQSSWLGKPTGELAVMEVDEGSYPTVARDLQPRGTVLTNIFRDQLDRFGEIETVEKLLNRGLEAMGPDSFRVVNVDDPSQASFLLNCRHGCTTYGLELDLPPDRFQNTGRDVKVCPSCSGVLDYHQLYYAHLGRYFCPACGYERPLPDLRLTAFETDPDGSSRLEIKIPGGNLHVKCSLQGIYNYYNILAAAGCGCAMKINPEIIKRGLEKAAPSFGRMEFFSRGKMTVITALVKNPVGANEVLRTVLSRPGDLNLLVAINDRAADGKDVSWLWDVDFEQLSTERDRLCGIVVSGLRAHDMAVRLKYAGFNPGDIMVEKNPALALKSAMDSTPGSGTLFILPTYTAMLEIRNNLNKMGLGKPYWEGS